MTTKQNIESTVATLALCHIGGISPRMMAALLTYFGNLERILNTNAGALMAIDGMTTELANSIITASESLDDAEVLYQRLKEQNIEPVSRFDENYPALLFELNDPPSLLYCRSNLIDSQKKTCAIAGAMTASNEGIELTTTLSKKLVEAEVQIVSSLQSGVSIAAHLGSRSCNGQNFAILDSGFENIYPEDNRPVAVDIIQTGGLISEYPPEIEYDADHYTDSNRLIAGLVQAVVITEFYKDSHMVIDLLECCSQIGKLAYVLIDPEHGALTDEDALNQAVSFGAIPMVGLDKIDEIIKSLV